MGDADCGGDARGEGDEAEHGSVLSVELRTES